MSMVPDDHGVVGSPLFVSRRPQMRSPQEVFFARVVRAAELAHRQDMAITTQSLVDQDEGLGVSKRALEVVLDSERFGDAMGQRGIPLSATPGLTVDQAHALAIYLDMTVPMTHRQKLKLIGITEATWKGWKRQSAFARELSVISEEALAGVRPIALQRIAEAVDKGEQWAILLSLEMDGRYDRRQSTFDFRAALQKIFTILDDSGVDPVVMQKIAASIRTMTGGGEQPAPVVQLTASPVDSPAGEEIAEPLEG